jgi:non-ribosomal peptide synthetase component E (peptide arylation enzyme)
LNTLGPRTSIIPTSSGPSARPVSGKIDGRGYVHIVGRGKDLIITGGYNVYPKEVEAEIDALPVMKKPSALNSAAVFSGMRQ